MKRMDQTGRAGGQRSEMHLRFATGRITGCAVVPQPGGSPEEITIPKRILIVEIVGAPVVFQLVR
jgi:hypothetical protein